MGLDFSWLVLALAIFTGTFVVLLGFLRRINEFYYDIKLGEKRHSLPPGDMGWPLIGNLYSYYRAFKSTNPESFISNLQQRFGRRAMYKNHLFGSPCVIMLTPEACRQVLMDDENFKHGYPTSTNKLTFRGALGGASKEEQKRIRRLSITPIKGHKALAIYTSHTEDVMLKALNEMALLSQQKPIEFLSEMRKATFKVIAHIFRGSSCSDSVAAQMEKHYGDYSGGLLSPWAINMPGFAFYTAMKARDMLGEILQEVLKERRAAKETDQQLGNKGLIDLLIEVDDDGVKLEDIDIIDILVSFLSAGHESTAHDSMWALRFLYQCPKALQRATEEQQEIIKRRPSTQKGLSLDEVRQMEYLSKVIDETLRMTNLTPSIFRDAKVDVNIQGYLIPKGWKVLVFNRGVHMDPEIYPNPKEFNPSRWDNHVSKPGAFIPFGGGPRICPGADLARVEMSIFLHYFLLNYKLELVNPECPTEYLPITRTTDKCLAKVIKLK